MHHQLTNAAAIRRHRRVQAWWSVFVVARFRHGRFSPTSIPQRPPREFPLKDPLARSMSQLPAVRAESWRDNVPRESLVTTHQTFRLMPLFFFLLAAPISATADQWPNNAVSGTVTFKGAPLAGVTVTAYNTNTSSITQVVTTGKDGTYRLQIPAWIDTAGDGADYHIWAIKRGYAFYPSAPAGATVTRADHTGDFAGNGIDDVPIYFTVVHYVSLPDRNNRGVAGPPLTGVNFIAYDGSNPPDRKSTRLNSSH